MKMLKAIVHKLLTSAGDERGFTIQELLVVMIVGSLLISLSLTTYMFATRLFLSWQAKSEGRAAVERVLQQMVYDIQRSKSIYSMTDSSLTLKSVGEKDISFSFGKGNVYRNGSPLIYQSGMTIAVKICHAAQDSGSVVRCLNVDVEGSIKNSLWKTNAVAAILPSSRGEFTSN